MKRLLTISTIAAIAFAIPAFAQGRFGAEAKEKEANRIEREAIRRAEHPEQFQAANSAPAAKQEAAPAPEPAPATPEPAPAPQPAPAPAQ
jgi:hypothetical protein